MNAKNMNRKQLTVDNYIVHIYRRQEDIRQTRGEAAADPQLQSLNGIVETPNGVRIVHIYRRHEDTCQTGEEAAADPQAQNLNGVIETPSGVRYVFHGARELWRILGAEPLGDNNQPRVKR